ncbi:hypothetical protein, partial [Spongiactinospora gelatinilytica]|uniref:hypothetical protein n=1 Tax=Spongiactinospora gelatinilytica TaxID=2666298 RepID=UPI0018F711D7
MMPAATEDVARHAPPPGPGRERARKRKRLRKFTMAPLASHADSAPEAAPHRHRAPKLAPAPPAPADEARTS